MSGGGVTWGGGGCDGGGVTPSPPPSSAWWANVIGQMHLQLRCVNIVKSPEGASPSWFRIGSVIVIRCT